MKANFTSRMARLEALNPANNPIAGLSTEEISQNLALVRVAIDYKRSGRAMVEQEMAETLGWSVEELQATTAQFLGVASEAEKRGWL